MILFAQNPNPNGPPPEAFAAVGLLVGGSYCVLFILAISMFAMTIYKLIKMSEALSACRPRNRTMEPAQVWLNFIPFFNIVWIIITFVRVSESLENEFESRKLRGDDDFGKTTAIMYFVSSIILCLPASVVFLFLYIAKLNSYVERIRRNNRDD